MRAAARGQAGAGAGAGAAARARLAGRRVRALDQRAHVVQQPAREQRGARLGARRERQQQRARAPHDVGRRARVLALEQRGALERRRTARRVRAALLVVAELLQHSREQRAVRVQRDSPAGRRRAERQIVQQVERADARARGLEREAARGALERARVEQRLVRRRVECQVLQRAERVAQRREAVRLLCGRTGRRVGAREEEGEGARLGAQRAAAGRGEEQRGQAAQRKMRRAARLARRRGLQEDRHAAREQDGQVRRRRAGGGGEQRGERGAERTAVRAPGRQLGPRARRRGLARRGGAHGVHERHALRRARAPLRLLLVEPVPLDLREVDPLLLGAVERDERVVAAALQLEAQRLARVLDLLVARVVVRHEPATHHRGRGRVAHALPPLPLEHRHAAAPRGARALARRRLLRLLARGLGAGGAAAGADQSSRRARSPSRGVGGARRRAGSRRVLAERGEPCCGCLLVRSLACARTPALARGAGLARVWRWSLARAWRRHLLAVGRLALARRRLGGLRWRGLVLDHARAARPVATREWPVWAAPAQWINLA